MAAPSPRDGDDGGCDAVSESGDSKFDASFEMDDERPSRPRGLDGESLRELLKEPPGESSTNYSCFPEQKCLYYLIKDGAGNGLTADGHYEVKYGKVGDLHVVAAGNEFDWIKAHFIGGPNTCAKKQ